MLLLPGIFVALFSGLASAGSVGSQRCGCLVDSGSGEFDLKPLATDDLKMRFTGLYEYDIPTTRVHFKIWNADYESGERTTFAFDLIFDLKKVNLKLIAGDDCLNAQDISLVNKETIKSLLRDYKNNPCYLRDNVPSKIVDGKVIFDSPTHLVKLFFDEKTCDQEGAYINIIGAADLTLKRNLNKRPMPGICDAKPVKFSEISKPMLYKMLFRITWFKEAIKKEFGGKIDEMLKSLQQMMK